MLKLSPTWQSLGSPQPNQNLYFLQRKRIWAKILESAQFHFPFIYFLLLHIAYLRSFSAKISERKYFPSRFFFSHFLVNQTDPLGSPFMRSCIRFIFFSVQFLSFIKTLISNSKSPNFNIVWVLFTLQIEEKSTWGSW